MLYNILHYIDQEKGVIVMISAFGIIPLAIVIYFLDETLKEFGLKYVSEFLGKLFALPIGVTWIGGFVISILGISSGISSLKILLIEVGLFLIVLMFSAINFDQMSIFLTDGTSPFKDKIKEKLKEKSQKQS